MKKRAIVILATVLSISFNAISQTTDSSKNDKTKVFTKVEKEAKFPGGAQGWRRYLESNLNADLATKCIKLKKNQKEAQQTVAVQFIVDKEGNISNVEVRNPAEVHPKLAKEAVRVIKEGPRWIPAEQNGRKVIYQAFQYITFQVSSE